VNHLEIPGGVAVLLIYSFNLHLLLCSECK